MKEVCKDVCLVVLRYVRPLLQRLTLGPFVERDAQTDGSVEYSIPASSMTTKNKRIMPVGMQGYYPCFDTCLMM